MDVLSPGPFLLLWMYIPPLPATSWDDEQNQQENAAERSVTIVPSDL